jgi:hypothetical protein
MATRATITIKRAEDVFDNLWYIHYDGYPSSLGVEIYENLKTVNDIERAHVIFRKNDCSSILETSYTAGEVVSIGEILALFNDYSYVFDEETEKWSYYEFDRHEQFDLERSLLNNF